MAARCNGIDLDSLDFGQCSTVDSMNVVSLKSGRKQSRHFGGMLHAGTLTRQSARASSAGCAQSLMPLRGTEPSFLCAALQNWL